MVNLITLCFHLNSLDCDESFSSDLMREVHARARVAVTRVVICVSRAFCSRRTKKKRLIVVYKYLGIRFPFSR